ncbi:YbgC/FadM family acyl-CoA thioesterase [Pedobacter petrophilus]|uniref:YbgC/FadM family acyl-CoA thioesterase n=1 Tax=Pedobacter petrophilus TaxID=1908241 RepID=A0A7K0FWV5_9SPHI|nr:thioesterase family protein [Pedobacter petrophilus]MRX76097.1 YbgC/FadM family acyl-CoA thioesterase [Pedobacter petrophilus]
MFVHETKVKVRYAETDQMGIVHHANYALYYEIARTECFEASSGITYESMEADGVMLPLLELQCKYLKPAFYNQVLTVKCLVKELPTVRLNVEYEIYNEEEQLINIGKTTLVFVDKSTRKPCQPPAIFMDGIKQYFTA